MKHIFQLLLLIPVLVFAQESDYKNEIIGVKDQWHRIPLNNDVLGQVQEDLSDIRIYAVSETNDTTEVPYFLEEQNTLQEKAGVSFKIINKSKSKNENYFTFKLNEPKEINEIFLDFKKENFNWNIDLQGSNDQKEWFNILEDYRILSILNKMTDYSFTTLKFPTAEYAYFRIKVKHNKKVNLRSATLQKTYERKVDLESVDNEFSVSDKDKKTIIDLKLDKRLPISEITLKFADDFDFQRPINFEYLVDSFKTEKGWKYNYRSFTNSYVSSLDNNQFFVNEIFTNSIRITITNYDNQALKIEDVETKILKYNLVARFLSANNECFMTYGNKDLRQANYDIKNFKQNIPADLTSLSLGKQISLKTGEVIEESIVTKWWLWAIIILIIALLGYSTLGMLKKAE